MREEWLVVKRSRTILGGFRVVQHGLTENEARSRAGSYSRPHEAMSKNVLVALRVKALAVSGDGR